MKFKSKEISSRFEIVIMHQPCQHQILLTQTHIYSQIHTEFQIMKCPLKLLPCYEQFLYPMVQKIHT